MNFIVFLIGSLAMIIGLLLVTIQKEYISMNYISTGVESIKKRPTKYYGITILIGLLVMVIGAGVMQGSKASALEGEIKEMNVEAEKSDKKLLEKVKELKVAEDKTEELDNKIEKLKDEIKSLTVLSDDEKELITKDYNEMSEEERTKVNTILKNVNGYNDETQKIINDNKDRIKKEKEIFNGNEKARKEKEEEEKKEKAAKEKKEEEEAQRKKEEAEEAEEARKNAETLSEKNAVQKAKDYLNYTSFSRTGLIDQLEYSGFTNEESVYAVDQIEVDWKEQAVQSAKDYLDYTSFSRTGLIGQLEYSGFTNEQAVYAVDEVGL